MARDYSSHAAFVQFAHRLADTAGDVARRHFRSTLSVTEKADKSPVTKADREIESAMAALIERQFPDHGIFGEEHGRRNESADYQWVLDPIDGTRAFIAGYPLFTTLIALTKDGDPLLGIIDQPINRERWVGVADEKTICNNQPVSTRNTQTLAQAVIATTSTYGYFSPPEAKAFESLRRQCGQTVPGGDAYAYAMLANGRIDIVVDANLKPYDFCALKTVIEGAGGAITDWKGNPVTIASGGRIVAAANLKLHRQALAILSQCPEQARKQSL